ncbi:MAG: alanine racemase, partial [Methyloceanibacter sp.]
MTQGRPAVAASEPGEVEADQATATAILTIDLSALAANYWRLAELCAPAECAAVVKADAYGLGMAACAPALARAGCRTFFVATPAEARDLRDLLPEATIYVFDGLLAGTAPILHAHALRPVLNSVAEIKEWAAFCATAGARL